MIANASVGPTVMQVTKARAAKPKRNRAVPKNIVRVVQQREEAGVVSKSYAANRTDAVENKETANTSDNANPPTSTNIKVCNKSTCACHKYTTLI